MLLAIVIGPSIELLRSDGTLKTAITFGSDAGYGPATIDIASSRNYVAGEAYIPPLNPLDGGVPDFEGFLLDRDGGVVWQHPIAAGTAAVYVGTDGTSAFYVENLGISTQIVDPGGHASTAGATTQGPPDDHGVLAAMVYNDGGVGWVRAGDTAIEPLQTPLTGSTSVTVGSRVLIEGSSATGRQVLSAVPADERPVVFSGGPVDMTTVSGAIGPWQATNPSYLLDRNWWEVVDVHGPWRVDLQAASATPLAFVPPSGLRLGKTWPHELLDEAGHTVAFLRDNNAGAVYVSPDGTSQWTRLGRPIANVPNVMLDDHAGTYVIQGMDGTYGSPASGETWDGAAPPADAVGYGVQIVRPSDGAAHFIAAGLVHLSFDGRCAVWADQDSLMVLDIPTDRLTRVALPAAAPQTIQRLMWVAAP
jgi:hypothetical protein